MVKVAGRIRVVRAAGGMRAVKVAGMIRVAEAQMVAAPRELIG